MVQNSASTPSAKAGSADGSSASSRPSALNQAMPSTPRSYRQASSVPAHSRADSPPPNVAPIGQQTPGGRPPAQRSASPVKPVFTPAGSPTKASKLLPGGPGAAMFASTAPTSTPRAGPPSPIRLQPTPGGIPHDQRVNKQTAQDDLLWPTKPYRHLLDVQSADSWAARREQAGMDTSLALHAAARARQNDYIIHEVEHQPHPAGILFHPEYETNVRQRNVLITRLIRDLKRTAYTLECQTDSFVLAYVVSPHENPNAFERMDENNSTVVRHMNPDAIHFKYRHIPASHRVNNTLKNEWVGTYNELERNIKYQLAKPHLEVWGTRRWAAGHAGTLTGSQQPFAEDDHDVFQSPENQAGNETRESRVARAQRNAAQAAGSGPIPLLPEHVARIAQDTAHEITLIGIVSALDTPSALDMLDKEGHTDKLGALELLTSATKDELNGYAASLALSWL